MYNILTKTDENRLEPFLENENFNFFLMWSILNFEGRSKTKKLARDICKGTLDIECERDWSPGLSSVLGDEKKIKNYFCTFERH